MPDFIGIGTRRSASSWLHTLMNNHPGIYKPTNGLHYFSEQKVNKEYYYNFFNQNKDESKINIEYSVSYSYPEYCSKCAEKIFNELPSVNLFTVLRNPYERAFSDFLRSKRMIEIPSDIQFNEVIKSYPDFLNRSKYQTILKPFIDLFGIKRLKIFIYEDLVSNPIYFAESFANYLGLQIPFQKEYILSSETKGKDLKYPILNSFYKKNKKNFVRFLKFFIKESNFNSFRKKFNKYNENINDYFYKNPDKVDYSFLKNYFNEDITYVENLLNRNLNIWRKHDPT